MAIIGKTYVHGTNGICRYRVIATTCDAPIRNTNIRHIREKFFFIPVSRDDPSRPKAVKDKDDKRTTRMILVIQNQTNSS
jgi:hypothetical protein